MTHDDYQKWLIENCPENTSHDDFVLFTSLVGALTIEQNKQAQQSTAAELMQRFFEPPLRS
jgi:hypothetical protein